MRHLPAFIALRYLRSPKSHSVINLISWIAGIALAIPTAALVIILSFHNGLSDTIEGMYNSFDSQIRITAIQGKYFDPESLDIKDVEGVSKISFVIEDNVLLRKGSREHLATIKGVDSNFRHVVPIENLITHGKYELELGDLQQAVIGEGISYHLGINVSLIQYLNIYSILPEKGKSILPTPIYRNDSIIPVGVYTLDEDSDSRFIFVPLEFAQRLLGFSGKVSSAEVLLKPNTDLSITKKAISAKLGDSFKVETRYEQKGSLYKAINQEKWIIYLLLMMVLLIAALSLAGNIIILISDKKEHISTLMGMGATTETVRSIFRWEGLLIVLIGSLSGLIIGVTFSLLQQHYGLIKMAGEFTMMDYYPARVKLTDIVTIIAGVWLAGWLLSFISTHATIKDDKKRFN